MGRRTILMIEVNEVLYRWCQGMGKKPIARSLKMSVNTVRDLITQAESLGLRRGLTEEAERERIAAEIKRLQAEKQLAPSLVQGLIGAHHEELKTWLEEPYMTRRQMQRLLGERGHVFSETSLRRYLDKHFTSGPQGTYPLPTLPGREAQVDFGYVGLMRDSKTQRHRKAYAFVMTLSHSRYRFVRFVFTQDVATWIDCHLRAFHFFGGVPEIIVIDNLKAGVIKPDLYDPVINRAFGELERHYGFVVDPTRVRTPKHKGKVERSVPIVRQQVIAGRTFKDIEEANQYALHWARYEIAQRVTRTTGEMPWARFERDEKAVLKPLPATAFDCPVWQEAKVNRDHHVVFKGAFYSVPCAHLGKSVWLRAGRTDLKIYVDATLIKVHPLATSKGQWVTDTADYPEAIQRYLPVDAAPYLSEARSYGTSVEAFIERATVPLTRTRQRKIVALFQLAKDYGAFRLNRACERALAYGNDTFTSVQRILEKGLDKVVLQEMSFSLIAAPLDGAYLRAPREFCREEGASWRQ